MVMAVAVAVTVAVALTAAMIVYVCLPSELPNKGQSDLGALESWAMPGWQQHLRLALDFGRMGLQDDRMMISCTLTRLRSSGVHRGQPL